MGSRGASVSNTDKASGGVLLLGSGSGVLVCRPNVAVCVVKKISTQVVKSEPVDREGRRERSRARFQREIQLRGSIRLANRWRRQHLSALGSGGGFV
jgi:hypothetical protein